MDDNANHAEVQRSDHGSGVVHPLRKVTVEEKDKALLQYIWEKLRDINEVFADQTRDNPRFFLALLAQPTSEHFYYWKGEWPSGIMSVTDILPGSVAVLHASFWEDEPLSERLDVARKLMGQMFEKYQLNRFTAVVPEFHRPSARAVQLLGFKYEGALRKAHLHAGRYHNVQLYGLLREEFDKQNKVN